MLFNFEMELHPKKLIDFKVHTYLLMIKLMSFQLFDYDFVLLRF